MKWPRVSPAWMYGDPANVVDSLLRASPRVQACAPAEPCRPRDRYYTQARRFHVKQLMKGRKW
jgi:hypothetical protein